MRSAVECWGRGVRGVEWGWRQGVRSTIEGVGCGVWGVEWGWRHGVRSAVSGASWGRTSDKGAGPNEGREERPGPAEPYPLHLQFGTLLS